MTPPGPQPRLLERRRASPAHPGSGSSTACRCCPALSTQIGLRHARYRGRYRNWCDRSERHGTSWWDPAPAPHGGTGSRVCRSHSFQTLSLKLLKILPKRSGSSERTFMRNRSEHSSESLYQDVRNSIESRVSLICRDPTENRLNQHFV